MMANAARRAVLAVCTVIGIWSAGLAPAGADSPEAFYKGRTVNLYIGFGPGGSYDLYARLLARHMPRHIPGNPQIVAQTMAGAGSITLANFLFNVAPKDGSAFGIVAQACAIEEALKSSGIAYKSAEFSWIGRATSTVEVIMAWHTSKVKTIEEALRFDVPTAGTGPASPSEGIPRLLNATAGTRFKVISGYNASAVALTAMERGEVDTAETSWATLKGTKPHWIAEHKINVLIQTALKRSPELQHVPVPAELGRTAEDKALLAFYVSSAEVGRSFIAPPGLPPDRLAVLRRAFDATMADPEFIDDVHKTKGEVEPRTGEEMQAFIAETVKAPPELVQRMKDVLTAK